VDLAAVGAHCALAEQLVVGRQFLHLSNNRLAVGVAVERLDRLEIVRHRRIDAGVDHGRVDALVLWRELLGELTVCVVEVPIPGLRHDQPLGGLQPERVHVGDEGEQRGELLAAAHDAEFGRLLD